MLLLFLLFVFVQHYLFLQIEFNNLAEREARVLRLVFASRKLERLIFLFMNRRPSFFFFLYFNEFFVLKCFTFFLDSDL